MATPTIKLQPAALPEKTLTIIDGMYRPLNIIGRGSFGEIFRGVNISNGKDVAIKVQRSNSKAPQLAFEAKVYAQLGAIAGLPMIYHFAAGEHSDAMVMELLGSSLEQLFNLCNRKFSLKTVLMLAECMLCRLETVHKCGFIHRDVKPDNFLMGLGPNSNRLYLIDFGLAKRYVNAATEKHIPFSAVHNLTGTVRYASIKAQLGHEQARRDDLESLSYCLLYFTLGQLPWQGLQASTMQQKYERILEVKRSFSGDKLSPSWPVEFALFLKYCRNLDFSATPDHVYLRQLLHSVYKKNTFQRNYLYDWHLLNCTSRSASGEQSLQAKEHNKENKCSKNQPEIRKA